MLLLVSGATRTTRPEGTGHLIVPKAWNDPAQLGLMPGRWAMDNGAFSGFDEGAFVRMLEAYQPYHASQGSRGCLFVTAPDVVGDAASTRKRWAFWARMIHAYDMPAAYVLQEGVESVGVPHDADAVFIGGKAAAFKWSPIVRSIVGYAKAKGQHVHAGRVNSAQRAHLMADLGVDSYDGGQFTMFPDLKIPLHQVWEDTRRQQPGLGL